MVMTEQTENHSVAHEDIRKCMKGKYEAQDYHSDAEHGGEDRQRRHGRADQSPSLDPNPELSGRRKPALVRSKTFDHSLLSQIQSEGDVKIERKKSQYSQLSKPNSQYHKIFQEISKDELLRQSYPCALQKDMLYQGRLFVSENWICFHSKVFGRDTKIAIPVASVSYIKKTKTAILVPNALVIATANDRHMFVSFLSRDTTYKILMSLCVHLEEKSPCSSPISSPENSFRAERPAHFPLGFAPDFSDLDGTVRQGGRDMDESSSSDSQSPDYEKVTEFPDSHPGFLDVLKSSEPPLVQLGPGTPPDLHLQQAPEPAPGTVNNGSLKSSEVVYDPRTMKPVSLNMLLFIYLFLVCVLVLSSCFMALKIVSLEQRLTTLGSMTEFSHNENEYLRANSVVNAEIYSELTLNLLKLEKSDPMPCPHHVQETPHDPQALCDALETGHEEPKTPAEECRASRVSVCDPRGESVRGGSRASMSWPGQD